MEEHTRQIPRHEAKPDAKLAVELSGVFKRFGDFTAVDDLDLAACEGEFLSLSGPPGCGKTTTPRIIAGFEDPTKGELPVAENVAFGPKRTDVPKGEIGKRVSVACDPATAFPRVTSPPKICSTIKSGVSPITNALSTVILTVTVILVAGESRVLAGREE